MQGRKWSLTAALVVGWLGALMAGTGAQGVKPTVWPWIDVYGVSGKPFGTIRIAQPVVHNIVSHGLIAEFVPSNGQTLAQLAATLWPGASPKCLHFNWIQINLSPGKLPLPVDVAGLPLNPPFLDPPLGGYQGDKKPADDLPWYLDETAYVPNTPDMNIKNPNITLTDVLRWYAKPYSSRVPDVMHFDTVLVLVNDCTSQYEPLGGFHWTATFPEAGDPKFSLMPFGAQEWFEHGRLIAAFGQNSPANRKPRVWTIRPLVKP